MVVGVGDVVLGFVVDEVEEFGEVVGRVGALVCHSRLDKLDVIWSKFHHSVRPDTIILITHLLLHPSKVEQPSLFFRVPNPRLNTHLISDWLRMLFWRQHRNADLFVVPLFELGYKSSPSMLGLSDKCVLADIRVGGVERVEVGLIGAGRGQLVVLTAQVVVFLVADGGVLDGGAGAPALEI